MFDLSALYVCKLDLCRRVWGRSFESILFILVKSSLENCRSLMGSYLDNSDCSWPKLSVAHIAPIGVCVAWESEGHLKKPLICKLPLAAFSSSTIHWTCYSCSLNWKSFWQKVLGLQFHLSSCGFLVVVKHIAKICIMHPLGCCSPSFCIICIIGSIFIWAPALLSSTTTGWWRSWERQLLLVLLLPFAYYHSFSFYCSLWNHKTFTTVMPACRFTVISPHFTVIPFFNGNCIIWQSHKCFRNILFWKQGTHDTHCFKNLLVLFRLSHSPHHKSHLVRSCISIGHLLQPSLQGVYQRPRAVTGYSQEKRSWYCF